MTLRINDTAPNFTANTTQGEISFHDWIGDGYAILFSHPKDFTPVCTTELGYMAGLAGEFADRNTKIIDPICSMAWRAAKASRCDFSPLMDAAVIDPIRWSAGPTRPSRLL